MFYCFFGCGRGFGLIKFFFIVIVGVFFIRIGGKRLKSFWMVCEYRLRKDTELGVNVFVK